MGVRESDGMSAETPWVGAWQIAGGRRTLTHLIVGDRTVCGRVVPGSARVYAAERLPVLCVKCAIEREMFGA